MLKFKKETIEPSPDVLSQCLEFTKTEAFLVLLQMVDIRKREILNIEMGRTMGNASKDFNRDDDIHKRGVVTGELNATDFVARVIDRWASECKRKLEASLKADAILGVKENA